MSSEGVVWTYSLASDVKVERVDAGAVLLTATTRTWVGPRELELVHILEASASTELQLRERLRSTGGDDDVETRCAALLFRLDQLGLLSRALWSRGHLLASCVPRRPAPEPPPTRPPDGPLRLSRLAFARATDTGVSMEAATSWATLTIHDRTLLPLLHDLSAGSAADAIVAAAVGHDEKAIVALLAMMGWCGLVATDEPGWSPHELLFHARTRRGYARAPLGKIHPEEDTTGQRQPASTASAARIVLETPDLNRLLTGDPPFAVVSERRRSSRRHGSVPLTSGQLSEFLFRTLHERSGRRPYPSGGSCYPLHGYLAVHRCLGIAPGLYAYDAVRHELLPVAESGAELDELLRDAAGAAGIAEAPQVVLVLAARYGRMRAVYGDLSYSLILKEVGAVFQAAMMAAAAMGVGTCPLGCGNSVVFAALTGLRPLDETSVGELMIGSLDEG